MKVINGRWSTNVYGDAITVESNNEFTDKLVRVKEFARGRELTSNKIDILFRILDTDESLDNALSSVLSMSREQLTQLFK